MFISVMFHGERKPIHRLNKCLVSCFLVQSTILQLCPITPHHTKFMYYIRPFLYDIINVSLRFRQCYFTKCIGYNTNSIGAHLF